MTDEEPARAVVIGISEPYLREADQYGEEVDRWVLEEERPLRGSVFERLEPGEVDGGVRSLRNHTVTFEATPVEINGQELVSIADAGPEQITVATYGDELGGGYRLREIQEEEVPEDVRELFPESRLNALPFRGEEFHELTYVDHEDHSYDLDELTGEPIDQAQDAINTINRRADGDEYQDRAFGYTTGFLL